MRFPFAIPVLSALLTFTVVTGVSQAAESKGEMVVAQATTKSNKANAPAAKRTTTTANYDGWIVTCVKDGKAREVCSANFRLINKEKKNLLMSWLVGFNSKKVMMSELVTPTDVMIAPGVEVIVDEGKPIKILYAACGSRGCKSNFAMTKKIQKSLSNGKKVSVKIVALDGRAISFNLEFQGFKKAYADLVKK